MEINVKQKEKQFEPIDFHIKIESMKELEIFRAILGQQCSKEIMNGLNTNHSAYTKFNEINISDIIKMLDRLFKNVQNIHDKIK